MVTQEKRLNAISNNIANVSTAGYKKDGVTMSTFGEHIAVRMNAYQAARTHAIGRGEWMQVTDVSFTDFSQGGFEMTTRPMDFAIAGAGYFVIRAQDDTEYLTRDGQFSMDEEGFLVHPNFGRVMGVDGDLYIGVSDFAVGPNGEVYRMPEDEDAELEMVGRMLIAIVEDTDLLEKGPNHMFIADEYEIGGPNDDSYTIIQGHVERSNVNVAMEMTEMMAAQRSLQAASQILKMYDQMTEQSGQRISQIR
jgi:flagellar basal body rod protein FlgG